MCTVMISAHSHNQICKVILDNRFGSSTLLSGTVDLKLKFVEPLRDPGVMVDCKLEFHPYVSYVVNNLAGFSKNLLRSTVKRFPQFMLKLLMPHIRPILN